MIDLDDLKDYKVRMGISEVKADGGWLVTHHCPTLEVRILVTREPNLSRVRGEFFWRGDSYASRAALVDGMNLAGYVLPAPDGVKPWEENARNPNTEPRKTPRRRAPLFRRVVPAPSPWARLFWRLVFPGLCLAAGLAIGRVFL